MQRWLETIKFSGRFKVGQTPSRKILAKRFGKLFSRRMKIALNFFYTFAAAACVSLLTSCGPSLTYVIDPSRSNQIAVGIPTMAKPLKVSVSAKELLNGDSVPFGNAWMKSCLKNSVKTVPGLIVANDKEAELSISVVRNGSASMKELKGKLKRVVSGMSSSEVIYYNLSYFYTITGNGKTWSSNIPHGYYLVVGDTASSGVHGQIYTASDKRTVVDFSSVKALDNEGTRQTLIKALAEAKKAGCFN